MRLSEKTIELNFCAQFAAKLSPPFWWFGLTQKQEEQAGWDAAAKVSGHWVRFQLKASRHVLKSGVRRFETPHHQLVALQDRATRPHAILYVLPMIGTTHELSAVGFSLLPQLRFLDVFDIPGANGPPTCKSGALRKSERHYIDLDPTGNAVTIHSDPVEARVVTAERVVGALENTRLSGLTVNDGTQEGLVDARQFLEAGRNRVALFLPRG